MALVLPLKRAVVNITKRRRRPAFVFFSLLRVEENMAPQWSCFLKTVLDDEEQLILILAVITAN